MIQEIKDLGLKLLRSLSYHGMSSIEFKFDSRDKKYKLMEINVRPVIPERLFVAAGMNFVYVSFLDLVRDVRRAVPSYEPDIYWIHNFFEAEQFPKDFMSNSLNVSDCIRPYMKKKVFCVPFFDDPLPFIVESGKLMGLISKKLLEFTGSRWLERDKEHAH
jgi:predicted ATP-grasp superfamily ATP-dependent carboligase